MLKLNKKINQRNSKTEKIKHFAKDLHDKLNVPLNNDLIPDNFLNSKGITKIDLLNDCRKIIRCSKTLNYKSATFKITDTQTPGQHSIEQKTNVFNTGFCNVPLLCPVCAEKLSRKRWTIIQPQVMKLIKKYKYVYFATFTTRDSDDLNDNYDTLNNALRTFFRMGQKRDDKRSGGEAAKIKAATIAKEIKKGSGSGKYHIHAHTILFCEKPLDYSVYDPNKKAAIIEKIETTENRKPTKADLAPAAKNIGYVDVIDNDGEIVSKPIAFSKLTNEWYKSTNFTGYNLHVKIITTPENFPENKDKLDSLMKTIREATKYSCKVSDFEREEIIDILANRKDKRFFSTTGELYDNDKGDERYTEEEIELNELYGFTYNRRLNKMERVGRIHEGMLYDQIERIEVYNEYKSKILKTYYKKEDIKKHIMKCYEYALKNQPELKLNKQYKVSTIAALDRVTKLYYTIKSTLYKKLILLEKEEPPAMVPEHLKALYTLPYIDHNLFLAKRLKGVTAGDKTIK